MLLSGGGPVRQLIAWQNLLEKALTGAPRLRLTLVLFKILTKIGLMRKGRPGKFPRALR